MPKTVGLTTGYSPLESKNHHGWGLTPLASAATADGRRPPALDGRWALGGAGGAPGERSSNHKWIAEIQIYSNQYLDLHLDFFVNRNRAFHIMLVSTRLRY